jgi:hypothetical protein
MSALACWQQLTTRSVRRSDYARANQQPQHRDNFASSGWEDRIGDSLRGLRLQHEE